MYKAVNIKWDTDGDTEVLRSLPTEMIIPDELAEYYSADRECATEEIKAKAKCEFDCWDDDDDNKDDVDAYWEDDKE